MSAKWFILPILILVPVSCLKVKLVVPELVTTGSTVALVCQYDLEGESLYAVKWYKDNYEFFRYLPSHPPPMKAFSMPGLKVDFSGSNAHQVSLLKVSKRARGTITCEVTTEVTYQTVTDSSYLNVTDLVRRPELNLSSTFWKKDVPFHINCSAQLTHPPPIIEFYIENKKVHEIYVKKLSQDLAMVSLSAIDDKIIDPQQESPILVRCEAYVRGEYHRTSDSVPIIPQITPEVSKTPSRIVELFVIVCIALLSVI